MAVDPPLMTLGQPKPSFKIEIVLDLFKLAFADEKAGEEANHDVSDKNSRSPFLKLKSLQNKNL